MQRTRLAAFSAVASLFIASLGVLPAFAGSQAAIRVEQLTPTMLGSWTLLSADGTSITSDGKDVANKRAYSYSTANFGQTTLSVTPPPGMSAKILVYRGGDLITTVTNQQYSFNLLNNDNYRFLIEYAYGKLGQLGVTSTPSGVNFRIKGPTGRSYGAVSPHTFTNLPPGSYAISFAATATCAKPAVKTVVVEAGKRNVTNVTFTCNAETDTNVDRSRPSKRSIQQYVEQRELKPLGDRK